MVHKNQVMIVGEFARKEVLDATVEGVEQAGYAASVYKSGMVAYEHISISGTAAIIRHRQIEAAKSGRVSNMVDSARAYLNPENAQNRARLAAQQRQKDIQLLYATAVKLDVPYLLLEPRMEGVTVLGTAGDLSDTLFYERDEDPGLSEGISGWLHTRLAQSQAPDLIARPNQT